MTELSSLIEQARASTHPFVVTFLSDEGIHWRGESESACKLMAEIIGNAKAMPREEFIAALIEVEIESREGSYE